MDINRNTKVGDIVKINFKTAHIFYKNDIDFCCGGGTSLFEACEKANVEIDQLLPELESLVVQNDPDSIYIDGLELDELCDYIEKRHHAYVNMNIPFLQEKLQILSNVHGDVHPELAEIKNLFDGACENLKAHMEKEELVLFPLIRKIVKNKNGVAKDEIREVLETINLLNEEHVTEGDRFERISSLTSNYNCPPDGCNTYKVTFQSLMEFEKDLHRHIHLENNILFKKALSLHK